MAALLLDEGRKVRQRRGAAAPQLRLVLRFPVQNLPEHRLGLGQPVHVAQRNTEVVERQGGGGAVWRKVGHRPGRPAFVFGERLLLEADGVHHRCVGGHVADGARILGRQAALFEAHDVGVFALGIQEATVRVIDERLGQACSGVFDADLALPPRQGFGPRRVGRCGIKVPDAAFVNGEDGDELHRVAAAVQARLAREIHAFARGGEGHRGLGVGAALRPRQGGVAAHQQGRRGPGRALGVVEERLPLLGLAVRVDLLVQGVQGVEPFAEWSGKA